MAACAAALMLFIQRAAPEAGDESLGACLAALRSQLPPQVKPATFDAQTRDVRDLRPMIDNAQRAQPEFEVPIWDYLARRTDAQRVAQGRELMKREAAALAAVERRHGAALVGGLAVEQAAMVALQRIERHQLGRHPHLDAPREAVGPAEAAQVARRGGQRIGHAAHDVGRRAAVAVAHEAHEGARHELRHPEGAGP